MRLRDGVRDRQAEAGAPARASGICAAEARECVWQKCRREARAFIDHVEFDETVPCASAETG
jgi:hypothetical protein